MSTTSDDAAQRRRQRHTALARNVVSPALHLGVPEELRRQVVPVLGRQRSPVLVGLNLNADVSTEDTRQRFLELYDRTLGQAGASQPRSIADCYVSCVLSPQEIQGLVAADREGSAARTVFRVWPDYTLHPHLDRSVPTIKSDAALRSYAATGGGVTWAVVNSGIDQQHPHFAADTPYRCSSQAALRLHLPAAPRAEPPRNRDVPLLDPQGHGTHVAGIIAGAVPNGAVPIIGSQQLSQDGPWGRTLARLPARPSW